MAKRTRVLASTPTAVTTPTSPVSMIGDMSISYAGQLTDNARDESPLTELESEPDAAELPLPKKRRRQVKEKELVAYDIPALEVRTTSFKGRLGYACLNTVLRASKPESIFCSRTCRIDTIQKNGLDFAKDIGLKNARDLGKLIEWNEKNKIRFMRISSEMFPFASHAKYGYALDYAAKELRAAGDLANYFGHRMTLHPGQFTQIASPKENVVEASVGELNYHCSILRLMGMGQDSVIVIHMGGMYGDKATTLERFKDNYRTKLTDEIRQRLVLENDEMCYSADDLLPICEELEIPLVLDYHHNWLNPTVLSLPELITRINAIWIKKGIKPKQHLSSPRPGAETLMEKRAHANRCHELPEGLPDDMDLMIEAKDKEQAVLQLYRIYGLEDVIWDNLRPEKSEEDQKKGGKRKSYVVDVGGENDVSVDKKKRRKVEGGKEQTDGESELDTPDEKNVVLTKEPPHVYGEEISSSTLRAKDQPKRGRTKNRK